MDITIVRPLKWFLGTWLLQAVVFVRVAVKHLLIFSALLKRMSHGLFSFLYPVGDDREICISYLLGLENAVAADFLCMTGLIKIGHSRTEKASVVVKAEWEKFIIEESLAV
jgi:hypothetical protein